LPWTTNSIQTPVKRWYNWPSAGSCITKFATKI